MTATPIDEDALAEAYNRALALEKAGEIDAAAAAYAEVLALDPDDHGGAAVRLASMGRGETPLRASQAYVTTLFDQHAEVFDSVLVDQLGYCVPLLLRQRLMDLALGPFARMLDLGCGTGLTGGALRDMADHVTGIDLSEDMVAVADEREVYDDLYVGDVVDFLEAEPDEESPATWDLVTATDVLPYLGDLAGLFSGVAGCCRAGGLFCFSSETLPEETLAGRAYMVGPHQRFAHAESYLRSCLDGSGFDWLDGSLITVRFEEGEPIAGHLVLAQRR